MRKHNQIHTLGAPRFKTHFQFLRKLKDFKCALWFEQYGTCTYSLCKNALNLLGS